MFNDLWSFLKSLELWEKCKPSSFWLSTIGVYMFFSASFGALFTESPSQSYAYVVLQQARGGGTEDYPFLGKRKKFDLDFHRQLEQNFPDDERRMDYQKNQEKFLKSAMRKKREIIRLRMREDPKFYTKEERDAMDYFQGNGIYAKYQDKREKYNIFDTRQSFLLKMHDDKFRNDFLNNLNRRKN